MLEHRPVLRERLLACAVFGAIAIGVVAAGDVMVTGGFDFPSMERGAHANTPNFFQTASLSWDDWAPQADARTFEARTVMAVDDSAEYFAESEDLAGADDGGAIALSSYIAPSEEELRREIEALYAALPSVQADVYEAEPVETYDTADAAPDVDEKGVSAYGSASPW